MAAMKSEPWIAVTSRKSDEAWVTRWAGNYMARLREEGATPVLVAPDAPVFLPDGCRFAPDGAGRFEAALLNHLDGLVLCGGGDVHPGQYGHALDGAEDHSIDEARDAMELALCREALVRDLPIFAICRGFQVLNVAGGGALVQHVDHHRSEPSAPVLHEVVVTPESRLARLVGEGRLPVNTYHHQGVNRLTLAPQLAPAAFDAVLGWLVEAAEAPAHRWVLGVQWHPERVCDWPEAGAQRRLWKSFVDATRQPRLTGAG